jgi:hypothetical protein
VLRPGDDPQRPVDTKSCLIVDLTLRSSCYSSSSVVNEALHGSFSRVAGIPYVDLVPLLPVVLDVILSAPVDNFDALLQVCRLFPFDPADHLMFYARQPDGVTHVRAFLSVWATRLSQPASVSRHDLRAVPFVAGSR